MKVADEISGVSGVSEMSTNARAERAVKKSMKTAGFTESYILGVGIALGGLASSLWEKVLTTGLWPGLIATIIVMIGYILLDLSLSEMVGVVPFAGGSFGFVRCSLGPTYGFMAAVAEMCVYMFYSIRTIQKIAQMVTFTSLMDQTWEPLWAFIAYLSVLVFHLRGGNWFWYTMISCTVFSAIFIGIFIFASFSVVDIQKWVYDEPGDHKGFEWDGNAYMESAYYPMWFYMGICALPLAGARVKDESTVLPKAIMGGMLTMSIVSILVLFCVACQSPGIGPTLLTNTKFALVYGFHNVLGMPIRYVPCLLIPPTYASATGFMFACKHQLSAMAESGLMPALFKQRFGPNNIPIYAVVFCTLIQYCVYLVFNYYALTKTAVIFKVAAVSACFMYTGVFLSFIQFRYKFANMPRNFVSIAGVSGAIIGIIIFAYVLVGLLFYQSHDDHAIPLSLLTFFILMMIYYYTYAQYTQFFSKEEQDKFMKAYILNANKKKKQSKFMKFIVSILRPCGLDRLVVTKKKVGGATSKNNSNAQSVRSVQGSANNRSNNSTIVSIASKTGAAGGGGSAAAAVVGTLTTSNSDSLMPSLLGGGNNKVGIEPNKGISSAKESLTKASPKAGAGLRASVGNNNSVLRSSFANGSTKLTWSGKNFSDNHESRKAFEIIHQLAAAVEDDEDDEGNNGNGNGGGGNGTVNSDAHSDVGPEIAEKLVEQFPDLFVPVPADDSPMMLAMQQAVRDVETGNGGKEDEEGDKDNGVRGAEST